MLSPVFRRGGVYKRVIPWSSGSDVGMGDGATQVLITWFYYGSEWSAETFSIDPDVWHCIDDVIVLKLQGGECWERLGP